MIGIFGGLGLLGLVIVALPLAGFQMIVLTTGSMSPGLPPGSLLVSRTVPASDVEVGDVVTVARRDGAPVTHRVVEVEGAASFADSRTLTLQGDANSSPDEDTYRVDRADVAMIGVPWGGQVVLALRSPWVLGVASVLVASLVLWSWWPRAEEDP